MPEREHTCCFTGYREYKLPWGSDESDPRCRKLQQQIFDAVDAVYADGIRHFICGMARGVDLYACEAVLQLREKYRDITVEAAIPCPSQPEGWPEDEQRRWHDLVDRCDYETVVQDHYDAGCMQRRNRYMVDHASLLIAVNDGARGGTRSTIEYAFKRGVNVLDIPLD